jgi:hypothetical protein
MRRLVFDRVVVRRGARAIGPITATFGPGLHGLSFARLEDLETLSRALTGRTPSIEGRLACDADGPRCELVSLGDLVPLPRGYGLARFARLMTPAGGHAVIARCGLEGGRMTDALGGLEALSFATSIVAVLEHVGAVLVPSPHTLVPATLEREGARLLRGLASAGLPVVVLLPPGLHDERFVDDVVRIDDDGRASPLTGARRRHELARGLRVRGEELTRLARHLVREGFAVGLDDDGRGLTLHATRLEEAERALTEALASHTGTIDEVSPCP